MHYAPARIEINGQLNAMVVSGQFYSAPPDRSEEEVRVSALARAHTIDATALREAAREIPVVDEQRVTQFRTWMERIARTFEHFGHERSEMISRFRRIADITTLQ